MLLIASGELNLDSVYIGSCVMNCCVAIAWVFLPVHMTDLYGFRSCRHRSAQLASGLGINSQQHDAAFDSRSCDVTMSRDNQWGSCAASV
jgi:hypothetical protein